MKIGVVSDIHSNAPALRAVLDALDAHDVDAIVCVGDILGILGDPNDAINLARDHFDHAIIGNHDAYAIPRYGFEPETDKMHAEHGLITEQITGENMEWISGLPDFKTLDEGVIMAHCRPELDDPTGHEAGDTGIPPREFTAQSPDGDILLTGHTHRQHAVNLDNFDGKSGLVLNPGSVGVPYYDGKARYAIVDTETQEYTLETAEYDPDELESHIESLDVRTTDPNRRGSMRTVSRL